MTTLWDYDGDGFQPEYEYDDDEYLHVCKDGTTVRLSELDDDHLRNIIRLYERKAKEGFTIRYVGGGWDTDSFYYDEETIKGEEALAYLNYYLYVAELDRRGLSKDAKPMGIVDVV